MANVLFKRGHSSTLPQTGTNGAFYLTEDTHRLYTCLVEGGPLVDLNKYVMVYDDIASLPAAGKKDDFAYAVEENIFAVYTGAKWQQVNPDTYVTNVTGAVGTTEDKSSSLNINVKSSNDTVGKTGVVNIKGGSNIHFSKDETGALVISADNDTTNTTYDLSADSIENGASIKLVGNNDTSDAINIKGTGKVSVAVSDSDITINGAETTTTNVGATFDSEGKFIVSVQNSDDTAAKSSVAITPTIKYGKNDEITGTASSVFSNGNAIVDVYTTGEVDNLISGALATADAMSFKGVIESTNDATTKLITTANVGDTYKMGITIVDPVVANIGDLVIAEGEDGAVTWTVIPSGDDQVISGVVTETSIEVKDNGTNPTLAKMIIDADGEDDETKAKITAEGIVSGKTTTITLKHGSAGVGSAVDYAEATEAEIQIAKNSITVPTITAIEKDANGHISGIIAKNYTIVDTHNSIDTVGIATAVNDTKTEGTITVSVKDADATSAKSDNIILRSTTLKIDNVTENENAGLSVDIAWGTF